MQKELEVLIGKGDYDLIGITKTWKDDTHNWNVRIEGYSWFKRARQIRKWGSGSITCKGDTYL